MAPRKKREPNNSDSVAGRPTKKKKILIKIIVKAKDRQQLIQWISDSVEENESKNDLIQLLLSTQSNDVAVTNEEIDKVLLRAARDGHVKACEILFEQLSNAGKKKYSRERWTGSTESPLHVAAKKGHLELARFCIERLKFNINQMDQGGHTPLYYATIGQYNTNSMRVAMLVFVKMTRFLLEEGADPNLVSDPEDIVTYPLYHALQGDDREKSVNTEQIIRLLLEHGADPNFNLKCDDIPEGCRCRRLLEIEHIILNGNWKILDALLQHGAFLPRGGPPLVENPGLVTVLNRFFSVSHRVRNGHCFLRSHPTTPKMKRSMCRVLVKHAKSNETVAQFLYLSLVHMSDKESCKILLNAGMNPILAMNYAIEKEKKKICQWLLELGVDPFDGSISTNDDQQRVPSPFQVAARLEDTSILELFLLHWNERFAANGGKDDNGDYPIHLLCCDPKVSLPSIKLVAESQAHTLTVVDGEESLYPFHFAAMWDAELDVIYTVLRHCPGAAIVLRR